MIISIVAAAWIFNRDIDWEARRREERQLGLVAEKNGQYPSAREHYENALANHPYDWETHLSLADLLNRHLNDVDGSLRHYLYAMAYSPDPAMAATLEERVAILRMVHAGELENPIDALEDMQTAVESGAEKAFYRRLSPGLRRDFEIYWTAWRARGRAAVVFCHIENQHNGFYDATLEMDFADGTTMSMHFYCPIRDIWRLELSFP